MKEKNKEAIMAFKVKEALQLVQKQKENLGDE